MEDMNLFDRFHAAFEQAPPRGAFERLQNDLLKHSAARRARPAFHVRWSKMTLRLTAAVAVVVIAIALVAAYIAAQRPSTGYVPAASDSSYRSVNNADHDAMINTYSYTDCLKFTDPTCAPRIDTIKAAAQKWLADLQATPAPPRFAVIDRLLRLHLNATITALSLASEAISANSDSAFNAALGLVGGHQAQWFERMTASIVYARTASASDYKQVVDAQRLSLESCALCLELGDGAFTDCADPKGSLCWMEVSSVSDQIAVMLGASVLMAAPSELSGHGSRLQSNLADADKALLDIEVALMSGSPARASELPSDRVTYQRALTGIQAEIAAILG